ncbi:cysteine-rich receptor-like protein kinase, partial [Trifolium pratense]
MIQWIWSIWTRLWRECRSQRCGGNELRSVWARLPRLFLSMAVQLMNSLLYGVLDKEIWYNIEENDPVSVSHLQFADDTLLLGVKSWANVRALRAVLVLFETMSGLKVNFNKSMLVGVNIPDSWLSEVASALCCKVGKIPFLYLGLPIG